MAKYFKTSDICFYSHPSSRLNLCIYPEMYDEDGVLHLDVYFCSDYGKVDLRFLDDYGEKGVLRFEV